MKAIRFWLLTALCAALLSGTSFARVISTVEDLVALGGTAVSEDITLQEGVYDLTGSNWRPILSVGEGCTLDGGNAVIKGLDISRRSGSSSSGKYGFVAENYGTITNLNVALTSGANTGTMSAGVIAAVNNGLISNCRVFGDADAPVTITASLCYAGGIAGSNRGTIRNCVVNDVNFATAGQKSFVGGIAGQMSGGFIFGCTVYNVSILINNSADAGGIAGVIEREESELCLSEINECSVLYSSLSGDGGNVGGIAGSAKSVLVSNCRVNYVDLRHTGSGICNIGGLVGEAVDLPGEQVDFSKNYYADVFSANMAFQSGDNAGGIAGYLYASDSTRSVFTKCVFCSDFTAVPDMCGSYQGNATSFNFIECGGESKWGMTCDGWAERALGEGWTNNGPEGYPVYSDKIPVSFSRLHRGDEYLPRSIYRLRYDGTDVADIGMVEGDTQFDPALFELYKTEDDDVPVVIDYITLNGVRMTDTVTASDYGQLNFSAVVDNSFCRDYLQPAVDEGNRIYEQGQKLYSASSLIALREAIDEAQLALDESYMSVTNQRGNDLVSAIGEVEMTKFIHEINLSANNARTFFKRDGEWTEAAFCGGTLSETIRLKAEPETGYRFVNWTDPAGNIVSEEAEFDYTVSRTTTLTANTVREDSFTFTYQDTYGKIYKVQEAADFSEIAYPVEAGQAGLRVGFTVKEWTSDYSGEMTGPVDCDVVFTASLQKTSALFTVHSEAAGVEEEVELKTAKIYTRTAPDTYEGNDFSYWKDSVTGKVLSYSPEVSFSVYSDMDIEAVYGAAAEGVTCANLWTAPSSAGKISFVGQVVRGADFASEEMHGVLLLRSDDPVNELVLDTQDVIVGKALGYSARTGTFIINKKNVSAGDTWYGRAFVIYRDNDGEQQVAYSDIKSVTL